MISIAQAPRRPAQFDPDDGLPDSPEPLPFEEAGEQDFSEPDSWDDEDQATTAPDYQVKPITDFTFLPASPGAGEATPENPAALLGDEVPMPTSPLDELNRKLSVREMIFYSLNNGSPLRIKYTTLDGLGRSERTILPDYVYWAGTNRHILVAWDEMNNDWRAFAVDNINMALLMEA
jgi:hypothetical protein